MIVYQSGLVFNSETYYVSFSRSKSRFLCYGGMNMSLFAVFMIGIGLSMDACAVSFAKGMCLQKNIAKYALLLAIAFGFSQGMMPLLGWWIGTYFEEFITAIDHWIAFLLLGFIGLNMLRESLHREEACTSVTTIHIKTICVLAIATSIDAFAIGISFAFLQVDILSAVCLIGATTFVISFLAVFLGHRIGGLFGRYAEAFGGIILIFIGLHILLEHLFG